MDWLHPTYLLTLIAAPAAAALLLWAAWRRRTALSLLGESKLIKSLIRQVSPRRRRWKGAFFVVGLALTSVALAGPRLGTKLKELKREGVDLVIALDVSQSMMAEDVLPSRLTKAKYEIGKLLDELEGDRVGLVLFAGDAFIQCPLTLDYSAVRLFLDIADPNQIPTPGTDFSAALSKTVQVFSGGENEEFSETPGTRALLIVSDGENHADIESALGSAREANMVMFAAGVGETDGVPIPLYQRGRQVGFKKDQEGTTVITRLEEDNLKDLARDGGYFRITRTASSLGELVGALQRLDRQALEAEIFEEYEEKYQWPLALAFLALACEFLFSDRSRRKRPSVVAVEEPEVMEEVEA